VLRSVFSQGGRLPHVAPDIQLPQVLQHASPEVLNHALRRLVQRQDGLPPAPNRELEELGIRFLAAISDSPYWSSDLSFADENHQTIAHLCALSGYTRLLTEVIDWGIDLDVRDVCGLTALHCAYLHEHWDCVRVLKEAGANEYIMDNQGRTPREMYRHAESEGTVDSEWGAGRFSSAGEETLLDTPNMSASPDYDTQVMLHLPLQISSGITAGGEAPRYGWSHLIYPPSPSGVQRNMLNGAPVGFHSVPATSSFDGLVPTFPVPEPAIPFPIPELAVSSSRVHHLEPIEPPSLFPGPDVSSFPVLEPAVPSFPVRQPAIRSPPVLGQGVPSFPGHHLEPVATPFLVPQPVIPWFPISGQAVPLFPNHHVDTVKPSFPITQPAIPAFPVPGPAVSSFPILEPAVPSFPVCQPSIHSSPVLDQGAPSFPGHHLEPFAPPVPVLQPAIPPIPASGQAVPSFPVYHSDIAELSFPIPQPTIPLFPVPGPAVSSFPVLEPAVPSFPVRQPSIRSSPVLDQGAPSFPGHRPEPFAPPVPVLQPAIPPFPASGQAVPSFLVHHSDIAELSFPIPQPAIPSFPVPGPTVSSFPVLEPAVPSLSVHQPITPWFPAPGPAVPSFPVPHLEPAVPSLSVRQPARPSTPVPGPAMSSLPILEPAVHSFPISEPTGSLEEINDHANLLSWSPSPQQNSPRMVPYLLTGHHTRVQTPPFHSPHATHSNSVLVSTRPRSPQSIQQLHQPSSSPRYVPPPSPPPPHYVSSEGVVRGSPLRLSKFEQYEKAAIRCQFEGAMRTAWPSANQEKGEQLIKYRIERKAVTPGMENGTLAGAGDASVQEPNQRED
jgi:hypothetical protein